MASLSELLCLPLFELVWDSLISLVTSVSRSVSIGSRWSLSMAYSVLLELPWTAPLISSSMFAVSISCWSGSVTTDFGVEAVCDSLSVVALPGVRGMLSFEVSIPGSTRFGVDSVPLALPGVHFQLLPFYCLCMNGHWLCLLG